jgi:hypothetical protein
MMLVQSLLNHQRNCCHCHCHCHRHRHPFNGGGIVKNENYEGLSNQFDLNFGQERDFYAKEAFSHKAQKKKPRMAGQSKTKNYDR